MKIVSSAFPQNKQPQVHSQSHQLIKKHLQNHQPPDVTIRDYRSDDLDELIKLQRQWFPINYGEEFYKRVIKGSAICYIAQVLIQPDGNQEIAVIAGAVIFEYNIESQDLEASWFSRVFTSELNSLYIMTLGVVDEMRSTGLAQKLLEKVVLYAQNNPKVKIIQLHVVDYNKRAIKFYKKHNFSLLDYLGEHYHIMGKEYDGFKLGLFVNGGKRREKWTPWFKRVIFRMEIIDQWPV